MGPEAYARNLVDFIEMGLHHMGRTINFLFLIIDEPKTTSSHSFGRDTVHYTRWVISESLETPSNSASPLIE